MYHLLRCLVLVGLLPTTAAADIEERCEELWFARNAMLNDAGYCFSTTLGRSLFNNADCTTRQPIVDRQVSEQISIIQRLERDPPFASITQSGQRKSCQIDTSQSSLSDVRYIELRKRVTFQPATDGASAGCLGYNGEPFLIHAAPDPQSRVLGRVEPGFSFSLSHLPWRDWNFALVWRDPSEGDPITIGWYRHDTGQNCSIIAG